MTPPSPPATPQTPASQTPASQTPAPQVTAPQTPAPQTPADARLRSQVLSGQPTEEELVAILAAVELVWPRPAPPPVAAEPLSRRWRFSGRWWSRSVISRRDRPWVGPQQH